MILNLVNSTDTDNTPPQNSDSGSFVMSKTLYTFTWEISS